MRVGVYIRQLVSLGGGNRHALAVAAHLSREHEVDVLTHTPLGASRIGTHLNLDLARARLRFLPAQPAAALAPITAEYDFFVNALHNMYIPCQARRGALLVFFPAQSRLGWTGQMRRQVALGLNRLLRVELGSHGVYEEEFHQGRRVRLLENQAELHLAGGLVPVPVTFHLLHPGPEDRQVELWLDGAKVRALRLAPGDESPQRLTLPPGPSHRLGIRTAGETPAWVPIPETMPEGLGHLRLLDFQVDHPRTRLYRFLFERAFPNWRDRLLHVPPDGFLAQVDTYDIIWGNSQFTQRWIQAYWGRSSQVLYPLVEVEAFRPLEKRRQILSVGRFFRAAHNKKHLLMVQAFKDLVDRGLTGWSLHLAGGVVDDPIHQTYLRSVQEAATGYPIHIHANAPFETLRRLYGESAIYWHAAGYGEDESRAPIKMEHFGVTTVEAMAAGCAPVVIRKGGQPEIIQHGVDGFLWDEVAELKAYTLRLVEDEALRRQLSRAAQASSQRFDRHHFGAQIDSSLSADLFRSRGHVNKP